MPRFEGLPKATAEVEAAGCVVKGLDRPEVDVCADPQFSLLHLPHSRRSYFRHASLGRDVYIWNGH